MNATDYLLKLQRKDNSSFSISVDDNLASSTLGPVDAKLAHNVLGEEGLLVVLKDLLDCIENETDQARLRWLAALTPKVAPVEEIVSLLDTETYAYVRYLAAKHLLDSGHHHMAITILHELTKKEPDQTPIAVQALLDRDEIAHLNWQLLRDVALMPNHSRACRAIATLWEAEDELTALPAALHLLATCSTEKNRDYQRWQVVESLMEHNQTEVALVAARWLALQPGSSYRLEPCNLLIENGKIEHAIPLLHVLAYEWHDAEALQACRRLLMFKQTERVLPLLLKRRNSSTPERHYEACLALAQINFLSSGQEFDLELYNQTRIAILNERQTLYRTVQKEFCQVGLRALETLEPMNQQARSIITLAQVSLKWLSGSFDVSGEIKPSDNQIYPAVSLNMALFDLRAAHIEFAKQRLMLLLTKHEQNLSHVIRLEAIKTIGKIRGGEITALLIEFLTDKDSRIRAAAATVLGPRGDTIALQPLIGALSDKDKKVRETAIWALRDLGDPIVTETLIHMLNDEENQVCKAATRALGDLGNSKATEPLIQALNDKDSSVCEFAAYGFWDLEDIAAFDPLIAALSNKKGNVRKAAALALGKLDDSRVVQPLIALLSDEEGSVRENAAYVLGQLADSTAVQPLINSLSDEKYRVRWYTAQALGKIGDSTAFKPLMMALSDEDKFVRYYAASALRQLDSPIGFESLLADLENENCEAYHSVILALGQLGHKITLQPLIALLNHEKKSIRSATALALGQLGDLDAIEPLITLLDDEESSVREFAGYAIREFKDSAITYPLMIALGDKQRDVRYSVTFALGILGNSKALLPLITALNDKDKYVRLNAALALGQLGKKSSLQSLISKFIDNNDEEMASSRITEALSRIGATEAISLLAGIIPPSRKAAFKCAKALIHLDIASALPFSFR